jgi:hypothetical protein
MSKSKNDRRVDESKENKLQLKKERIRLFRKSHVRAGPGCSTETTQTQ